MGFRLGLAVAAGIVFHLTPCAARPPKPVACRGGRFLILNGAQLIGDETPQSGAIVVESPPDTAAIGSACAPTHARVTATRKGTTVKAVFRRCTGIAGKLRLHARFSSDCGSLAGRLTGKHRNATFTAMRSRCGDGVFDPANGESCDAGAGCAADRTCSAECACVPTNVSTTTTTPTPPTTTTTLPRPTSIVTGAVLASDGAPLPGVGVSIAGTTISTTTDALGQFRLTGVPVGVRALLVDGSTALDPRTFPPLSFGLHVEEGLDAGLRRPIYLPPVDMATATEVAVDDEGRATATHVITSTAIADDGTPLMQLTIPRGTRVTFASGTPSPITISPVPTNKVPMALAGGKGSLSYFTVQPHDLHFDPAAPVRYANMAGLPPGFAVDMMSFDHDAGRYVSRGPGQVSADGKAIESLPGSGLTEGGWHAPGFDTESTTPKGEVDHCGDQGDTLRRAAFLMHQADGDMDNSLEAIDQAEHTLLLGELKHLGGEALEKGIDVAVEKVLGLEVVPELLAAGGEITLALGGVALVGHGVTDFTIEMLEANEEMEQSDEHFKQFEEHADQAIELLHMLNECKPETDPKLEAAAALASDPGLRGEEPTIAAQPGALSGVSGDLATDTASVDQLESQLNQLLAAANGSSSVRATGRASSLTEEQARQLLQQIVTEAQQLQTSLHATVSQVQAVVDTSQMVEAREQLFLTQFAAIFQGASATVAGVPSGETDVGTIPVVSSVAGVSVVSSGVTWFTDTAGRFKLYGVPGAVVNRATGQKTPLPVIVEADDGALTGLRPDTDDDGIPDDWELMNGLDPNDPGDALRDDDGDGLSNLDEYASGGDPHSRDTDHDGVDDLTQVESGRMPMAPPIPASLALFTASPTRGAVGQRVTLTGTGFDRTSANDTVDFGAVAATVLDATDTTLSVLVPDGARSGNVTVTVGGATSNALRFTVLVPPPPVAPAPLGVVAIPGSANAVDANGSVAFVAAGGAGLVMVDVSDPTQPTVGATLAVGTNAEDVRVVGGRAYVAGGTVLAIVDVSDPAVPKLLGSADTTGDARDVAVAGNLAAVAESATGIELFDVGDPRAPRRIAGLAIPGSAKGIDLAGSVAVVAAGSGGVQVVDVSKPASPAVVGAVATPGDARDVVVRDGIAYVAAYDGSLGLVDVSRPEKPAILGEATADVGGYLTGVAVDDGADPHLAFGADVRFVNGIPIVNVASPTSPVPQGFLDFSMLPGARDDNGTGIAVDARHVFLTAAQNVNDKAASADSRLYVGQYRLPQDTAGNPPEVVITSPPPGATFVPGERIALGAAATDDVAVARVDFTVGGQDAGSDSVTPFEGAAVAPNTLGPLVVGASATDLGGNVGQAGTVTVDVITDPGTTVTGVVQDGTGATVAGATVTATGGLTGTSGSDGAFSIAGVPTAALTVTASALVTRNDGTALVGNAAPVSRVRGGTTDVGTIVVRGAFDVSADFSIATNPNGVWSYGATRTPGSLSLYTQIFTTGNNFDGWHLASGIPESLGAPAVVKNLLDVPNSLNGTYPPHQVAFHPGGNGELAVVRFTAPATADYRIDSALGGGDAGTKRVHVFQGTTELFQQVVGPPAPFVTSRRLASGDTVDFAVDPFDNFFGDTTFVSATITPVSGGARYLGPLPYRSRADSPFDLSGLGTAFFLEDFESGALAVPGATASAGRVLDPSAITDSVDGDDGTIDGQGVAGHSWVVDDESTGVTFTFDATALGGLPTDVGLVWTDGSGATVFEAFDAQGASLGTIGPIPLADGSFSGTTAEDRFLGVTYPGGIGAVTIHDTGSGQLEVDHLQYGRAPAATTGAR